MSACRRQLCGRSPITRGGRESPRAAPVAGRGLTESYRRPPMFKTTPEQNKALVLEAFDTLFNRRDYAAAERYWSERYIQHSAHIPPGRDGLFSLVRSLPETIIGNNSADYSANPPAEESGGNDIAGIARDGRVLVWRNQLMQSKANR